MKDLTFKIIEIKPDEKYPISVISAICIQDKISLTIKIANEDIKDKEFVKSILKAEHSKILENMEKKEIKIGDII